MGTPEATNENVYVAPQNMSPPPRTTNDILPDYAALYPARVHPVDPRIILVRGQR